MERAGLCDWLFLVLTNLKFVLLYNDLYLIQTYTEEFKMHDFIYVSKAEAKPVKSEL